MTPTPSCAFCARKILIRACDGTLYAHCFVYGRAMSLDAPAEKCRCYRATRGHTS